MDDVYFRSLRGNLYGYASVTVLDLITHLYATYGNITPHELEENDKRIRQPYDVTQPFETFTAQIEDSVEYANAGNTPFTAEQVLAIAYNVLFATGAFRDECKEWRKLPPQNRTWPRMKVLFGNAHRDLRREQTAAQQGYGTANGVQIFEDINETLGKLAHATLEDRRAMANLTQANVKLSEEVEAIKSINLAIRQLQVSLSAMQNASNKNSTPVCTPVVVPNNAGTDKQNKKERKPNQWCWTHGINKSHNSANCNRRAEGHQEKATIDNMMGSTLDGNPIGKK